MRIRDSRIYFDCDHCGSKNIFARPKGLEIRNVTLIVCEGCYNQLVFSQREEVKQQIIKEKKEKLNKVKQDYINLKGGAT